MFSRDTLELLTDILNQMQLPVGHPDFEQQAHRLITAKRELGEAFDQIKDEESN